MPGAEDISRARRTVAVIGGTGALGFGLALRWAVAGVPVVIGSRRAEAAAEAAGRVAEQARAAAGEGAGAVEGLLNQEAAEQSRTVFLTVPFRAQSENLNNLRSALQPDSILVDATVPMAAAIGGKATRTVGVWQGSAAQQAEEMVPRGVSVVSALHTVSAKTLADLDASFDEDVLVCGDDRHAKGQVAELIAKIPGLRPVDCGDLELARLTEQLTPLLISVNKRYRIKHSGVRLTGLPDELW